MYNKNEYKNDRFIKLPNYTLLNDNKEVSLLQQCRYENKTNYALLPVMVYLKKNEDFRYNTTTFTIKKMIEWCGLKCEKRKDKKCTFNQFLEVITFLLNKNLIELVNDIDFQNLKPNTEIVIKEKYTLERGVKHFIKIKYSIAEYIMQNIKDSKERLGCFVVWCYLEARKDKRKNNPKVCFPSYDSLQRELSINSRTTISSYTSRLKDIRVLYYNNEGIKKDGGITKVDSNYYSTVDSLSSDAYSLARYEVDRVVKTKKELSEQDKKMEEAIQEIEQERMEQQYNLQNRDSRDISIFLDDDF